MVLLNARLSQRSARGYARVSRVIRPTLASFSVIAAQERADARRLVALGARPDQVVVTGNLKFAVDPLALRAAYQAEHQRLGGALQDRPVWLAASTHPGEEEAVLNGVFSLEGRLAERAVDAGTASPRARRLHSRTAGDAELYR